MTIPVDMDDTIEQLLNAWVSGIKEKYSRSVECDEITSWDVSASYDRLTFKQVYDIPVLPGFWKTEEPICGCLFAILGGASKVVEMTEAAL